jgi:radical SAM-linked protein
VDTPTGSSPAPASEPAVAPAAAPAEARQRWRLTFARDAGPAYPTGRDYAALWEAALTASRLPVAVTDAGRLRFSLAAPLPATTAGLGELADIWLVDRLPAWRVREALEPVVPGGHAIRHIEDIWPGAPPLPGRVAAADYLVTLRGRPDRRAVAAAIERLLAADRLIRERAKGGGVKSYDLRPLLIGIHAADGSDDDAVAVRIRARIHPELGSGRPDEVIAALADMLGAPLEADAVVRERIVLSDDLAR